MAVVELEGISKAYDLKVAVRDLSFRIDPGTMFGLLGPNGAGKTSTIRMMIGITLPDSGVVRLFDQPFTREHLRRVGYLPEERGLYKRMKVLDQLVFMGQLRGLSEQQARQRSLVWCEKLAITEAMEKKTQELSKGMQQKIQFIAALLHEPDLIIMDEPFSGLDPVNAILLQDTLLELRDHGKATLFSTHRMDQVEKMCDAICLVDRGVPVLAGSMREVKSRYPRNRVLLEYEGNDTWSEDPAVARAKNYGNHVELKLKDGADSQALLRRLVAAGRVNRFELVEPSLEEIFIQTVGGNVDA